MWWNNLAVYFQTATYVTTLYLLEILHRVAILILHRKGDQDPRNFHRAWLLLLFIRNILHCYATTLEFPRLTVLSVMQDFEHPPYNTCILSPFSWGDGLLAVVGSLNCSGSRFRVKGGYGLV